MIDPVVLTDCTVYATQPGSGTVQPTILATRAIVTNHEQAHTITVEQRSTTTHGLWDEMLRLEQTRAVSTSGAIMVWTGNQNGEQVRLIVQAGPQVRCGPCAKHRR